MIWRELTSPHVTHAAFSASTHLTIVGVRPLSGKSCAWPIRVSRHLRLTITALLTAFSAHRASVATLLTITTLLTESTTLLTKSTLLLTKAASVATLLSVTTLLTKPTLLTKTTWRATTFAAHRRLRSHATIHSTLTYRNSRLTVTTLLLTIAALLLTIVVGYNASTLITKTAALLTIAALLLAVATLHCSATTAFAHLCSPNLIILIRFITLKLIAPTHLLCLSCINMNKGFSNAYRHSKSRRMFNNS